MNLKQLEYFVSVAETLNFTKAAKKMFYIPDGYDAADPGFGRRNRGRSFYKG